MRRGLMVLVAGLVIGLSSAPAAHAGVTTRKAM
jgi:hypothetical protein